MEYSDPFSQANENPLSSGGVWENGYTSQFDCQLTSHKVGGTTTSISDNIATYNGFTPTDDQFAQVKLASWSNGSVFHNGGVVLRASAPPTATYYLVQAAIDDVASNSRIGIYKRVAGSKSTLVEVAKSFSANDVLTAFIRGNTIFAFINNALIASVTDSSSPLTSGRIGMALLFGGGGSFSDVELSDFAGGDIRKTRFYLPNTGAAEISPAFNLGSSWTATTGADRIRMDIKRISSTMTSKVQAAPGTAANQKWLFRQYVSDPLGGGGDIFGVLFGQIRGLESAANDNIDAISLKLLVVDALGSLRGTLLSLGNYGTIAELNTSLRNKIIANGDALIVVTAQNGDRIVAEIGLTNTAAGTSVSGTLSFGDDNATDLTEDETDTTAHNPWLEIIGMKLQLGRMPMTKPNLYAVKRTAFH